MFALILKLSEHNKPASVLLEAHYSKAILTGILHLTFLVQRSRYYVKITLYMQEASKYEITMKQCN